MAKTKSSRKKSRSKASKRLSLSVLNLSFKTVAVTGILFLSFIALIVFFYQTRYQKFDQRSQAETSDSENTLILQQGHGGYNGVSDAMLHSNRQNRNLSGNNKFIVQSDNWIEGILRFDLSGVPANRQIERAELQIYLLSKNDNARTHIELYPVLLDWSNNEVSWKKASDSTRWTEAGANGVGVDRAADSVAVATVDDTKTWYTFTITDTVRNWVNHPEENRGFLLRGNNSNSVEFRFASSEHINQELRPALKIWLSPLAVTPTSVPPMEPTPTLPPQATPTTLPTLPAATPTQPAHGWWKPTTDAPIHFHWQIGTAFNPQTDFIPGVTVYDIDGWDTPASVVDAIHDRGHIAICYMDVGGWEAGRPDSDQFPSSVKGRKMPGWPEYYLDIRSPIVRNLMAQRIQVCKDKGFDALEPDVIDSYANNSGFPLTYQDQLEYNRFIADQAHQRGMSVGLKGDIDQALDLATDFDWTLNEECAAYNECSRLNAFRVLNKAIFQVEYSGGTSFCADANANRRNAQRRNLDLTRNGTRVVCVPDSQSSW